MDLTQDFQPEIQGISVMKKEYQVKVGDYEHHSAVNNDYTNLATGLKNHRHSGTNYQSGSSVEKNEKSSFSAIHTLLQGDQKYLNVVQQSPQRDISNTSLTAHLQQTLSQELKEISQQLKSPKQKVDEQTAEQFNRIAKLGYVPENISTSNAQITFKKDSSDYRKYQLKNNSNELRPFYLWKDGFMDNYLKYCSPESIKRRAKRLNKPLYSQYIEETSLEKIEVVSPKKPYLEGNFDKKVIIIERNAAVDKNRDQVKKKERFNEGISSLKSSLFNSRDKIYPINKYYYNENGSMSRSGRKRKHYGIQSYIDQTDKEFVLARLTQEYGGKAVQILNKIEESKGMEEDEKILSDYQGFRLNSSTILNTETQMKSNGTLVDLGKLNFQLQVQTGHKTSQETSIMETTGQASEFNDINRRSGRHSFLSQPRMPIQNVSIRPNKITVYLNALTEDGQFECKNLLMKLSDILSMDIQTFLAFCQVKFETRCALKHIFSSDGSNITNLQQYLINHSVIQEIFVSTYPYYIGQKIPLESEDDKKVQEQILAKQLNNFEDSGGLTITTDKDKLSMPPLANSPLKNYDILMMLKQRQQTPSLLAKPTEIKPDLTFMKSQYHTPTKTGQNFFGKMTHTNFTHSQQDKEHSKFKNSPFSNRKTVFQILDNPNDPLKQYPQDSHAARTSVFPTLTNFKDQNQPRRTSVPVSQMNVITTAIEPLSELSFKDYVSTFSKEEDFVNKPYAKFYQDAIKRHREQLYAQMSQMNSQKKYIIDRVRISEHEMPLPESSKSVLGEILNREKGKPVHKRNSSRIGNVGSKGTKDRNDASLILRTNEKKSLPIENEQTSRIQVIQIANDQEELKRLQEISGTVIQRCLKIAHKLSLINKEVLYSSLLSNWFIRYKNQRNPFIEVDPNQQIIEEKIFNSIRDMSIYGHNRKSFQRIQTEIKNLRNDLQSLFNNIAKRDQNSITQSGQQNQSLIAEFVQTVGLTNADLEGYGTRLTAKFNGQSVDQSMDTTQSEGDHNMILPITLVPRVNVESGLIKVQSLKKGFDMNNEQQERALTPDHMDFSLYNESYIKLKNALYSKEELQILRQLYQIMVCAMGSISYINLKTLRSIQTDQKHLFTEKEIQSLLQRLYNIQNLPMNGQDIKMEDEQLESGSVTVDEQSLANNNSVSWNQFFRLLSNLRYQKIITQIKNEVTQNQKKGEKTKTQMLKSNEIMNNQAKKLISLIFENYISAPLDPDMYFTIDQLELEDDDNIEIISAEKCAQLSIIESVSDEQSKTNQSHQINMSPSNNLKLVKVQPISTPQSEENSQIIELSMNQQSNNLEIESHESCPRCCQYMPEQEVLPQLIKPQVFQQQEKQQQYQISNFSSPDPPQMSSYGQSSTSKVLTPSRLLNDQDKDGSASSFKINTQKLHQLDIDEKEESINEEDMNISEESVNEDVIAEGTFQDCSKDTNQNEIRYQQEYLTYMDIQRPITEVKQMNITPKRLPISQAFTPRNQKQTLTHYYLQTSNQKTSPVSDTPFLQRVHTSEAKRRLKIDYMRLEKVTDEISKMRPLPKINKKSNLIISSSPNRGQSFFHTQLLHAEETRRKKEEKRIEIEKAQLINFTGRPEITDLAKKCPKRGVEALMFWKTNLNLKRIEKSLYASRNKRELEEKEQAGSHVNKGSLKYLSHKENLKVKVEDRLIKFGSTVKLKLMQQEIEQIEKSRKLANQVHQKKNRDHTKICKNQMIEDKISPELLKDIQESRSRQAGYQMYIMSKYKTVDQRQEETVLQESQQQQFPENQAVYMSFGITQNPNQQSIQQVSSIVKKKVKESQTKVNYETNPTQSLTSKELSQEKLSLSSPLRMQQLQFNQYTLSPPTFSDVSRTSSLKAIDLYQQIRELAHIQDFQNLQEPPEIQSDQQNQIINEDPYGWNIPHLKHPSDLSLAYMDPSSQQNYHNQMLTQQSPQTYQESIASPHYIEFSSEKKQPLRIKFNPIKSPSKFKSVSGTQLYERCKQWEIDKRLRIDKQRSMALQTLVKPFTK